MKQKNDSGSIEQTTHKSRFFRIITHNFWLKMISLLFAILLWSYVVNETNPMRTRTFTQLPVSIIGISQLNQSGLVPLQELLKEQLTVRITVNVSHRDYRQTNAETFDVSLDLSRITTTGTHVIPVRVTSSNTDVTVLSVTPASVEIEVDTLDTSVIPLQLNITGTLPENLIRETALLTPDKITLTGPKQHLSRISRAVADVDLSKMTDGYTANMPYYFLDEEGNMVTPVNVTASAQSVLVDMGIRTKKTVQVDYSDAFTNQDQLAAGFMLKSIVTAVTEIDVYGSEDVLAQLESVKVQPVDLTGASESLSDIVLKPILPEGVSLVNATTQLRATVLISEQETNKNFSVQIKNTGLSSDLKAQLSSTSVTVTLYGPISKLENIKAADIQIILNLAGKQAGTYEMTLTPVISGDSAGITVSTQPSTVTVTIKKK